MLRAVSSQRNTPANLPLNGTTALLKMLLAVGKRLRWMIGFRLYRQTALKSSLDLGCHGMFGHGAPMIVLDTVVSSATPEAAIARNTAAEFSSLDTKLT